MEAQADLSLHWAHMSESTFSHIAALFYSIQIHVMVVRRTLMVTHLIAGDIGDVKNGRSIPGCCPTGFTYGSDGTCVMNPNCTSPCLEQICKYGNFIIYII